jgi:hypothetical protein
MALVTLRSYRDPVHAELARAQLELAGIEAVLLDQHLASIQWLYSTAIGGVKLAVEEEDLETARRVLDRRSRAHLTVVPDPVSSPGEGDACPFCGSFTVRPSRLQRNAAALSLATGLPFAAWSRKWFCTQCGHAWKTPRRPVSALPPETLEAEQSVQRRASYPTIRVLLMVLLGLATLYLIQLGIPEG